MNKKGFTLIELLAVIVILGVISVIAIPIISNIINETKINTLKATASNFAEALYNKCTVNQTKGLNPIIDINMKDNNNLGIDTLDDFINTNNNTSKLLGKTNDQCDVSLAIYDDKIKSCAYKLSNNDKIKVAQVDHEYRCLLNANVRDEDKMYTIGYQSSDTSIVPTDSSCFSFNKANGYISGYNDDCPKNVIIPGYIDGRKVTTIAAYAFRRKELESVLMPETITYISSMAFAYNNITTVGLGTGLKTIVGDAFSSNLVTELTIPDSITSMSGFAQNPLVKVSFGKGVETITSSAFYNAKSLKYVDLSSSINLTSIQNSAFKNTGLEEIILPNSLVDIEAKAFQGTQLTNINIPESVKVIEAKAFDISSLNQINVINKGSLNDFNTLGTSWNGNCLNINFITEKDN